jgi:hypothetical protein
MRSAIAILGLGGVLLAGAAIHRQAIAQNQAVPIPQVTQSPQTFTIKPPPKTTLSQRDRQEFDYIIGLAKAGKLPESSFGELVQAIATEFKGYGYTADLLDQREPEALNISLKQFDCVLFVEAMLGLARTVQDQDYAEATFVNGMEAQRYRDGKLGNYCSRLHYFSEWILENQRQGRLQDLGEVLGGIPLDKSLDFMSVNWRKYPRLVAQSGNRDCIQAMEQQLGQVNLRYVPTDRIHDAYPQLQPGDIVAIATSARGLDVTHTGLVYRRGEGNVGLIHAAPSVGVIVSPDLQRYVERLGGEAMADGRSETIGILVARPTGK